MPESFTCSEFPCNHGKDTPTTCYVNRSTEKSIIINLHLLVVILGRKINQRENCIFWQFQVSYFTLLNCIRSVSIKLYEHGIEKIKIGLSSCCSKTSQGSFDWQARKPNEKDFWKLGNFNMFDENDMLPFHLLRLQWLTVLATPGISTLVIDALRDENKQHVFEFWYSDY